MASVRLWTNLSGIIGPTRTGGSNGTPTRRDRTSCSWPPAVAVHQARRGRRVLSTVAPGAALYGGANGPSSSRPCQFASCTSMMSCSLAGSGSTATRTRVHVRVSSVDGCRFGYQRYRCRISAPRGVR